MSTSFATRVRRRLPGPRKFVLGLLRVAIWGYVVTLVVVAALTAAWVGFQILVQAEMIAVAWFAVSGYGIVILLLLFVSYLLARR